MWQRNAGREPGVKVVNYIEVEGMPVEGRPPLPLALGTAIDLSADIAAAGTRRVEVSLSPTPGPASRLNCRVTVVS